jgi:hypothetical protein
LKNYITTETKSCKINFAALFVGDFLKNLIGILSEAAEPVNRAIKSITIFNLDPPPVILSKN